MAVEIEFLKGLPKDTQMRLLNEMSLSGGNVPIQIDGEVFWIPKEVQDLIDNLSNYVEELGGKIND